MLQQIGRPAVRGRGAGERWWPLAWSLITAAARPDTAQGDPALLKYRDYVTANATHRSRTRYMSPHQTIRHFLFDPVFLWPKVRVKPTCKWGDVTSGSVSAIVWTACRQVWRWKLCQPSFIAGPSIRYGAHGAVMVTLSAPPSLSCHTVSISTVHRPADHSSVPHSRNLLTQHSTTLHLYFSMALCLHKNVIFEVSPILNAWRMQKLKMFLLKYEH